MHKSFWVFTRRHCLFRDQRLGTLMMGHTCSPEKLVPDQITTHYHVCSITSLVLILSQMNQFHYNTCDFFKIKFFLSHTHPGIPIFFFSIFLSKFFTHFSLSMRTTCLLSRFYLFFSSECCLADVPHYVIF